VPARAVQADAELAPRVFVLDPDSMQVRSRPVDTGRLSGDMIEILDRACRRRGNRCRRRRLPGRGHAVTRMRQHGEQAVPRERGRMACNEYRRIFGPHPGRRLAAGGHHGRWRRYGFQGMGKLEDPAFTIKMAKIITRYPGASAQEVQDEVTYHLEDAMQKLPQLKRIKMSVSRPGCPTFSSSSRMSTAPRSCPISFDELRRKVTDVRPKLPPGAQAPMVIDDFGDVYGVYLMLTGEGYSWRDLYDVADDIKRQLVLVDGRAQGGDRRRAARGGVPGYLAGAPAELGIDPAASPACWGRRTTVVDAGNVRVGDDYLRIKPTGAISSVQDMGDVLISSRERKLSACATSPRSPAPTKKCPPSSTTTTANRPSASVSAWPRDAMWSTWASASTGSLPSCSRYPRGHAAGGRL
jgi:hypothetical protein